jgi:nitric oxide dioxygenase
MLKQETICTVKSTAPVIREKGEEITTRMYEILFTKYPETKEMFKNAPPEQYRILANAIIAYSSNVDNLPALEKAIEKMVQKHVETNVKPEHYPMVGDALLTAIKEVLDPDEEVVKAWEEAYNFLAEVLIKEEEKAYKQLETVK